MKLSSFSHVKVYPDLDINNIVEANHYARIGNWCKLGKKKCRGPAKMVKPYRCLGKCSRARYSSSTNY